MGLGKVMIKRFHLLTNTQRWLFGAVFIATVLMVVNTMYLLIAGHIAGVGDDPESLPVTYQIMLFFHLAAGIFLVLLALVFVGFHLLTMYRRGRPRWMRVSGGVLISALLALMLSGFFILSEANSRENVWVFVSHQVLAALFVAAYLSHRFLSRHKPLFATSFRLSLACGCVFATLWVVHYVELHTWRVRLDVSTQQAEITSPPELLLAQVGSDQTKRTAQQSSGRLDEQAQTMPGALALVEDWVPFYPVGDRPEDSPFFPSLTATSTGDYLTARVLTNDDLPDLDAFAAETKQHGFAPSFFLGAQSCERCHADIVAQWATSAHRFSSFNNPFYRRSVELTREKIGKKASQFCGGCHDPAVMLPGNMLKEIDPLTPESQAGLTCLSCHAIDGVDGLAGNANYNVHNKTLSPYLFDQAKSGLGMEIHDYLLKAKPTVHKKRMKREVFEQSEFCLSCHKVNLDVPVNDFRWLRGQNEYDAWHNSGVALNQPRTWYEPPVSRECQGCHMPLEDSVLGDVAAKGGKVKSHRFLAVNTALPALRGDRETIEKMEALMRDKMLRLEVFAVRRGDDSLIMSARDHHITVAPGELIQVDVVVRNLGVGHTFPGGTNDSNEGWIDFRAQIDGEKVFHNGWLDEKLHVDPAAHFYKAVIVDRYGQRIAKRNASDIYAAVYANVIGPSTSDIARYRFRVPENAREGSELVIDARLMWRKFNQEYTEFVFEGQTLPEIPITEIETDRITLNIGHVENTHRLAPLDSDEKRWMRYNDYGVGSVLDGDTRTALLAFAEVARLHPEKMEGWLHQARAHLQEGALGSAEVKLRKASELAPNHPRIAFFWGNFLEKSGRLEEAVKAYERTLQTYPDSRDTWVRLGRVYWLMGDHQASIKAYLEVLRIDPEHAQAFHQLNLAYKAMADNATDAELKRQYHGAAVEFEKAFNKYKIDEDATRVTRLYREAHPHDNRMSQRIVIHEEG